MNLTIYVQGLSPTGKTLYVFSHGISVFLLRHFNRPGVSLFQFLAHPYAGNLNGESCLLIGFPRRQM